MNKQDIIQQLKQNRSNLSASSLNTYSSSLNSLFKKLDIKSIDDVNKKANNIIEFINNEKNNEVNKTKSLFSALYIFSNNDKFQNAMSKALKQYNEDLKEMKKSKKDKDNWVSSDDIKNLFEKYKELAISQVNSKKIYDFSEIIDFILLIFYGGLFFPPRRLLDYSLLLKSVPKLKEDRDKFNYYDAKNKEFVFNIYKTANKYGKQILKIENNDLITFLNKWVKLNPTEYMIFSTNFKRLSPIQINQHLNKLFGQKTSVNILRKVYINNQYDKLGGAKVVKELQSMANDMANSVGAQMNNYVKF